MAKARIKFKGFFATVLALNIIVVQIAMASVISTGDYNKDFFVAFSPSHVNTSADGGTRSLRLDKESGARFESNDMFLFGKFDMQLKLVPGYSAGTVVTFHLMSGQPNRDEIDFEFLGNVLGQPYILQTNVFTAGMGDREERINLWFDPTVEFHTYSIFWNIYQIVFMVDSIPIRTYRNHADEGAGYPRSQPMPVMASIWDGSDWATNGGRDKVDWSKAPFMASYGSYKIDACVWKGNPSVCKEANSENWWNQGGLSSLTRVQKRFRKWVREYHMVYDYCQDHERFNGSLPLECSLPKY